MLLKTKVPAVSSPAHRDGHGRQRALPPASAVHGASSHVKRGVQGVCHRRHRALNFTCIRSAAACAAPARSSAAVQRTCVAHHLLPLLRRARSAALHIETPPSQHVAHPINTHAKQSNPVASYRSALQPRQVVARAQSRPPECARRPAQASPAVLAGLLPRWGMEHQQVPV
jgi:hypothetical protein